MPKITFSATGESHEVAEGTSFLDFCQANDAPIPFGCTVGSCGTCCLVIEAGAEFVDAMGEDERDTVEMASDVEGVRLGCQLIVRADITVRAAGS